MITEQIEIWISGWPPSMKNSREIVTNPRTGNPFSIKSPQARQWWNDALRQITGDKKLCWGRHSDPLRVTCHVWYRNKRPDLDCSIVLDLLQAAGVISNDRHVYEFHQFKRFVTPAYPEDGVQVIVEKLYCGTGKDR